MFICPNCRVSYEDFRTGFTYQDIYDTLWKPTDDRSQWLKGKGRHVVLGRWHEIKLKMWKHHVSHCRTGKHDGEKRKEMRYEENEKTY